MLFEILIPSLSEYTLPQRGMNVLPTILSKYRYITLKIEFKLFGAREEVSPQEIRKLIRVPTPSIMNGLINKIFNFKEKYFFGLPLQNKNTNKKRVNGTLKAANRVNIPWKVEILPVNKKCNSINAAEVKKKKCKFVTFPIDSKRAIGNTSKKLENR